MRLSVLAVAACVGLGSYWISDDEPTAAPAAPRASRTAQLPAITAPTPSLADEDEPVLVAPAETDDDEPIRGLAPITDPAELAMVFSLDGTTFVRLSDEERASSRGTPRRLDVGELHAVIAPVAATAMPHALQRWLGKTVLVDGKCRARVVGFAEVSRVIGEAEEPEYLEDGSVTPSAPWTIDRIVETGVTLAAELDACDGTWARAADYSPAAIAEIDHDQELEAAAMRDLFANADAELQQGWKDAGGEGDWRDTAEVVTFTWQHPLTSERWVFVQARHRGTCGDPTAGAMAAYRASADGTIRRAADLEFGYEDVREVLDVDGDGQPELVLGGPYDVDRSELVDLANERHESIDVPVHSYGCPC